MNLEMYRPNADAGQTEPGATELLEGETPLDVLPTRAQVIRRRVFWAIGGIAAAAALIGIGSVFIPRADPVVDVNSQWTAEPSEVTAADLAVAIASCQDELSPAAGSLLAAERRGNAVALMQEAEDNGHDFCLLALEPGAKSHTLILSGWSGFDEPVVVGSDELVNDAVFFTGTGFGGPNTITGGTVGDKVVGVTFHVGQLVVEATVEDGSFLVWWPQDVPVEQGGFGKQSEDDEYLVPDTGPEDYEGLTPGEQAMTYDLHLKDGTTLAGLDFWTRDADDSGVSATAE